MSDSLDVVDEFYAPAINRVILRDFYTLIGGEEGLAVLEQRHRKVIRQSMAKTADAQPGEVRYTQGEHDVLRKAMPKLISMIMAQLQFHTRVEIDARKRIMELEAKIAALEAERAAQTTPDLPSKHSDAGNVVSFEPGILRQVASA